MLLDLTSKGSNFIVFLLNDTVKSFALLADDSDLVFSFRVDFLCGIVVVGQSSLELFIFVTDDFELVLEFSHLRS